VGAIGFESGSGAPHAADDRVVGQAARNTRKEAGEFGIMTFSGYRPFSGELLDPLHLKGRTDFELQVNREFRLPTDVHLPPESWVLARRGAPLSLGGDWRLSDNAAIGVISQLIWKIPERFYYKADGDRFRYAHDGAGRIIARQLDVKHCLIGMLDLREIDRRTIGAVERRGAVLMDLVDFWVQMDVKTQLRYVDQYAGQKS
jgi:hypothetical protein